jgi:ribonuclease BN (tRNA processing enzyme)
LVAESFPPINFKTHAPARREGTTLQPNIHNEQNIFQNIFGLNHLTTDHVAGLFFFRLGLVSFFHPQLGVYTQQNNENTHIKLKILGLRRPY